MRKQYYMIWYERSSYVYRLINVGISFGAVCKYALFSLGEHIEIVCEKSYYGIQSKAITCPLNEVISVKNANYGRTEKEICGTSSTIACYSRNSFEIVSNKCAGKQDCIIEASNSISGDPCVGVEKYLRVVYKCIKSK